MKKNYALITLLLLIFSVGGNAQVNYSFSAATATYVPVTGGTTPPLINRPYTGFGSFSKTFDEGVANSIPIGFIFNYNGINYSYINICANGFATLGSPFSENINSTENYYINDLKDGPIDYIDSSFSNNTRDTTFAPGIFLVRGLTKPILAPLWDDLSCQADANLRYVTTGSAGSRVFTFEWSKANWQFDATGSTISFELKLYESTNIIEFCYKDEGGTPNNASASIGITANRTFGGGFMSLENTSSLPSVSTCVETDTLSAKPASNQVYRFIPLACKMPVTINVESYTSTAVTFGWTAPLGQTNFEYAVTTSSCAPTQPGIATSATKVTVSSLQPATKYYIYVRSICSASSQSAWAISQEPPYFITADNPVPLPYTEGFETLPPYVVYYYSYGLPSNFRIQDLYDSSSLPYNGNLGYPYYVGGQERYDHFWNAINDPSNIIGARDFSHSGNGVMFSNIAVSKADEWFYLPGFTLTGGKSYKLKFYYNTADPSSNPNTLEVKYGQAVGAAAMTSGTLFTNTAINNTVYQGDSALFTPSITGNYYIGFHSFVDSGKGFLLLDDISLEEISSLPVTLLNFSGDVQGKQNLLHWTTATEQNNTGFEVQRSSDGNKFNKIGFVNTKANNGNSNNKITYNFTDNNYTVSTSFYRLKQIDKDNKSSYSNIIVLRNNNDAPGVSFVYPSPAKHILNVKIASQVSKKITLLITDLSGRLIFNKVSNITTGETIVPLDVSKFSAGIYFLKISSTDLKEIAVMKFVKE